jgi:hypothetical protein
MSRSELIMDKPDEVSSAEIFAEYHRRDRSRVLRPLLVIVGLLAVGGILVASFTVANQGQQSAAGSSTGTPGPPLTAENFLSVINEAGKQAKSGHIAMTVTAAGTTVTMDGDFADGDTAADSVMAVKLNLPPDSDISMRLVGGIVYANFGEKTQNKFVSINPADPASTLGPNFSSLLKRANPASQSESLADAISTVEVGGAPELIDGVQATPYNVSVKSSVIAASLGVTGAAAAALPAELTYVYWVGPDNLIRKITIDVAGTVSEITISKWGDAVTVTAPTADEIIVIAGLS